MSADDQARGTERLPPAKPSQMRSVRTFEAILSSAAEILEESGLDKLSTNLVCSRCGLTPPALYRYFSDKFAILEELARRLMDVQDSALVQWIEANGLAVDTLDASFASNYAIQMAVNDATAKFTGGLAVMQAIRSVRRLRAIRLASHEYAAERLYAGMREGEAQRHVSDNDLRVAARVIIDISYCATEMVAQEQDRDRERVTAEVIWMLTLYMAKFPTRPKVQSRDHTGMSV